MAARPQADTTGTARRGGTRFLLVLLACLPLLAQAAGEDEALAQVRAFTQGGATQLSLRLIDRQQPAPTDVENWMRWEKQRYALYRAQRDWAALTARVASLPDGLPDEFLRWVHTEAARAELNAGHAGAARRLLRAQLLAGTGNPDEQAEWRQLVIRSYLLDNNVTDALTAVAAYRADFNANAPAWRLLEATILIRAGRARDAYTRLGDIKTHDAQLLTLIAALRGGVLPPATVLTRAQALAEETRQKPALSFQAWALAAEAAGRARDWPRQLHALERALTLARAQAASEQLVAVRADDLWQAYAHHAESVGNAARLLVGDDAAWLKLAGSYTRDEALPARAVHALLVSLGASAETRELASRQLADSLVEDGRGEVLRALYATSSRYPGIESVPEYVRYRLADLALAGYDIEFAARCLQGLDRPPNGEDPNAWALRQARVFIYAGKYGEANALLTGILTGPDKLTDTFTERYLQVIFDLQAAERHAQAIGLLETLMQRVENPRTRREILYWIAESKAALGEPQQAAELYLRSASYNHPTGGDMWGQTARFHAAEQLGRAGLTQDARLVFQALLRHTADAKQRAVIERQIQQLWLIETRTTTR